MAGKTTNYTEAFNIKRSLSKKDCPYYNALRGTERRYIKKEQL